MKSFLRVFCLLSILISTTARAQQSDRRQMMYTVGSVVETDSVYAIIFSGKVDGLFDGATGVARAVYKNVNRGETTLGGGGELGRATVVAAGDTISVIVIELADSVDASKYIFEGDVIEVATDLPEREYRGVFFDFARLDISFLDNDGIPLFSRNAVLQNDSPGYEQTLLEKMVLEAHRTADFIRDLIPDNSQWDIDIEGGRYAGMKMVDAMAGSTRDDVYAFLLFVRSYPGKYLGQDWKINETYATWLINNAPPGEEELRDSLLATKGTPRFQELISAYQADLSDGVFTSTWNDTVTRWARKGRIEEAYRLSSIVESIASTTDDGSLKGWTYYYRAEAAGENDEYENRVEWYRQAIDLFRSSGDGNGEELAANNLGDAFNDQDQYIDALSLFDEVIGLREDRDGDERTELFNRNLAGSYLGRATSLLHMGRPDEALVSYRTADSLYMSGLSLKSQRGHGSTLIEISKTLRTLSRYESARSTLEEAIHLYSSLGLQEGEADALDELGFLLATNQQSDEAKDVFERAYRLHVATDNIRDAGYSMSQIGQMQWQLKHYEKAIEAHRRAIEHREATGDKTGLAYSYTKLGGLYKDSGDPTAAIEAYDAAAAVYKSVGDQSGSADVLESLGDLYVAEGDFERGTRTHKNALAIRENLGARADVATSFSDVASALFSDGKYAESHEYYQRSADLRREMNDRAGLTRELANLGNLAHFQDRDYDAAMRLYNEAVEIATEIDSRPDLAYCFRGLGKIALDRGNGEDALRYFQRSLKLESDASNISSTLISIGGIYQTRGRFDLANEQFSDAASLADSANSRRDLSSAYNALGDLYRLTGSLAQSLQYAFRSLRIAREVDNPWGMASAHVGVGNTYNEMGANELAISNYLAADSLYRKAGFELARATPLNNIGTIHYHQGDFAGSLPLFADALKLQDNARIRDEFTVILLANTGESVFEMGRLEESESWLQRALSLSDSLQAYRIGASVRNTFGRLRMRQNRPQEAERFLRESIRLSTASGEQREEISAASQLGELLIETGRTAEAREMLTRNVTRARSLGLKRYLWQPLAALGRLDRSEGRLSDATTRLTESVEVVEELKSRLAFGEEARTNFTKDGERSKVYEDLIALLIEQGQTELALGYVERSHSEALRRQWTNLNIQFGDSDKASAVQQSSKLQSQIEELDRQIADQKSSSRGDEKQELIRSLEARREVAEKDYVGFVNRTIRKYPKLKQYLSASVNPKDLVRAKKNIPDDTAVIAFLVGARNTFLFAADADTVIAVVVDISQESVIRMTSAVVKGLKKPGKGISRGAGAVADAYSDRDRFDEAVAGLSDLLISPVASVLASKSKIAVIPSGTLMRLPFQILSDGSGNRLVDRFTIYYTTTLDIFLNTPARSDLRVVAFGNADQTLEWSEREVNEIAKVLPATQVFVRGEATEDRVKELSTEYNVLHLATHGILDYSEFENSYLTLAGNDEKGEDGRLTISEIWDMDGLDDFRLVTLSACETAVNDNDTDGWPISPANAFLDHVPSVVASLWPVDDIATSILMEDFYRNLQTMGTADALRMAQLSLANGNDFSDPYYWAPFVVMGDWR